MSSHRGSPAVLADWDMTFFAGFTVLLWADHLAGRGLLASATARALHGLHHAFRLQRLQYGEFCSQAASCYVEGLAGKPRPLIEETTDDFVAEHRDKVHDFARKTAAFLRARSIPLFVVSGAPSEPLNAYARDLGFQVAGALTAKVDASGVYTGEVDVNHGLLRNKRDAVAAIQENHRVVLAFADSRNDMPLLEAAEHGVLVLADHSPQDIEHKNLRAHSPTELSAHMREILESSLDR